MFLISNCCFWIKYESIIHNNTSSSEVIWSESGEKSAQIKHRLQDKTVQTNMLVDFDVRDNRRWTFLLEKALLWTHILVIKNVLMLDLFLRNTQLLSSPDVNWWTGVDYCDVLSAVWTLILTAPIHSRRSIGEQVMQCYISPNLMKKQTHLHLGWPEGEYIFIFLVNYSFKKTSEEISHCESQAIQPWL